MEPVLQHTLPVAPWADPRLRRLPGTLPLDMADWLRVDEAYAAQMALRARLIAERRDEVIGVTPQAEAAVAELYAFVLDHLPAAFARDGETVLCPDGRRVALDAARPLETLGHLVQEDLCLMEEDGAGEHLLSAALLCFPAGWRLSEKLGRAMMRIHLPVGKYTEDVGRRVQRLLDGVRPGAALWRANAHHSRAPLFNPLSETAPKDAAGQAEMPFIRSERQCLIRLPQTRALLFSIHTYVVPRAALTPEQAQALEDFPIHRAD
jgi:hypothetical protein